MRPGFDLLRDPEPQGAVEPFLMQVAVLLGLLQEDAMASARRFARCCGRDEALPVDMIVALRFHAHEFFRADEATQLIRYQAAWANARAAQETEADDSDDDDPDDASEGGSADDEPGSPLTEADLCAPTAFATGDAADCAFHALALRHHTDWAEWDPEDPAQAVLKQALDSTCTAFGLAVGG